MTGSTIRIGSAANLAYAPQYVAASLGFFDEAGIRVSAVPSSPGTTGIVGDLLAGRTDLVLGSVLFAQRMAELSGGDARIVAGANRNSRHVLMARNGEFEDGLTWAQLRGRVVNVAPTFVPTSWFAFREGLRRSGLSLDDVPTLVGFQPQHVIDEFREGAGDLLYIGGEEGQHPDLHPVATMADGYGPIPWSVYCASERWAAQHSSDLSAFRAGLTRGMEWMFEADVGDVVAQLQPDFPHLNGERIAHTVLGYRQIPFWSRTAELDLASLQEWQDTLIRCGMIAPGTDLMALAVSH